MATMTAREEAAKEQIIRKLRSEGYPTYARLFDLFDLNLTDNLDVVGYMLPGKAKIVLNENLSIDQVSTIVRHEILHEWLSHGSRSEKFDKEHPDLLPDHDTSNIAADYEISNVGYTDKDKRAARAIILGDRTLQGLVTEDQYPGWEDKSFEEMYEELLKKNLEEKKQLLNVLKQLHKMLPEDEDDQNQSQPSGTPSDPNSDSDSSDNQNSNSSNPSADINSSELGQGDNKSQSDDQEEQSKADKAQQALDDAKDDIKDDSIYDLKNKLLAESKKQQVKAKLDGDIYDNQGDENFALNDLYTSIGFVSDKYIDEEYLVDTLLEIFADCIGKGSASGSYRASGDWRWYGDSSIDYNEVDFDMDVWVAGIEVVDVDEAD